MTATLAVTQGRDHVGQLVRLRGRISFTYADSWRFRQGATPLSVSMPLALPNHDHRVVEPWLWGLLPDNEQVLARWGREFHTTTVHPLGLLARQGRDVPGAFQIAPAGEPTAFADEALKGGVDWLTDQDVAERLRDVRLDQTAWLGRDGQARWSLAGAQAKMALRREDGRWGVPRGEKATTHILKPAVFGLDDHDLNEHLCLDAARSLGLLAVRSSVVDFEGERAIVVERYDRLQIGRVVRRVHQEDLCQALGVPPARKYQSDGGPSVASVATLLREVMPGPVGVRAREQFTDALLLNWLLAAPDAHAKNYALLLSGSDVRLAPLYDVASALPYRQFHEPKIKLAMKIGNRYEASKLGGSQWGAAAKDLGLDAEAMIRRGLQLAEELPDALSMVASRDSIRALGSRLPALLVDLVADRARRCAATLGMA